MKKYAGLIIQLIIGGCVGVLAGVMAGKYLPEFETAWPLLIALVSFVFSFFIHIILHEGGHLVCGLLSGYKFVSFRVGSLILVKIDGKYHLKKFNIPGTGGQCLLDPPDMENGTYPAKLYNLGGGLSNLIFSVIAMLIVVVSGNQYAAVLLLPFILCGLLLGLTNLIPMKVSGIANDGYNLLSLGKDDVGGLALWQQLRINKLQCEGVRLKDMDEDLFALAHSDVEGNPLVDQMKVFWLQRLLDEKRFEEAEVFARKILRIPNLLALFRFMVQGELLYMELIGQCRADLVQQRYTKSLKKFLKKVKSYPSTQRIYYAYAVRLEQNQKKAAKAEKAFQKAIKTHPVLGEIEMEKDLFKEV